jgi:hypothetical protein
MSDKLREALLRLAAECHRVKWQFEDRDIAAFREFDRIGEAARAALAAAPAAPQPPDFLALANDSLRTAEKGIVGYARLRTDVAANLSGAYELGKFAAAPAEEDEAARIWKETAEQHCRNELFYRDIVRQIGEMFGVAARTSDDGSIQQDVLALRVPELVAALLKRAPVEEDARVAGLKEAAKVCDERSQWAENQITSPDAAFFAAYSNACDDCAEMIRVLRAKLPAPAEDGWRPITDAMIEKAARAHDPVGWNWYDNARVDHPAKPIFVMDQMTRMRNALATLPPAPEGGER